MLQVIFLDDDRVEVHIFNDILMEIMHKITASILSILVSGCASTAYVDRDVDVNDFRSFSKITTDSEISHDVLRGLNAYVVITHLDGRSLYQPFSVPDYPLEINVAPGRHEMKIRFTRYNSFAAGCVEFESEAGTNYVIKKRIEGYRIRFWIEEAGGRTVGALCGGLQPA